MFPPAYTLEKWALLQIDQIIEFCCPIETLSPWGPSRRILPSDTPSPSPLPSSAHPFSYISNPIQFDVLEDEVRTPRDFDDDDDDVDDSISEILHGSRISEGEAHSAAVGSSSSDDFISSLQLRFHKYVFSRRVSESELYYSKRSAIEFLLRIEDQKNRREGRERNRPGPREDVIDGIVRSTARRSDEMLRNLLGIGGDDGLVVRSPRSPRIRRTQPTRRSPRRDRDRDRDRDRTSPRTPMRTRWTRHLRLSPDSPPRTSPNPYAQHAILRTSPRNGNSPNRRGSPNRNRNRKRKGSTARRRRRRNVSGSDGFRRTFMGSGSGPGSGSPRSSPRSSPRRTRDRTSRTGPSHSHSHSASVSFGDDSSGSDEGDQDQDEERGIGLVVDETDSELRRRSFPYFAGSVPSPSDTIVSEIEMRELRSFKGRNLASLKLIPDRTRKRLAMRRKRKILRWALAQEKGLCDLAKIRSACLATTPTSLRPVVVAVLFSMAFDFADDPEISEEIEISSSSSIVSSPRVSPDETEAETGNEADSQPRPERERVGTQEKVLRNAVDVLGSLYQSRLSRAAKTAGSMEEETEEKEEEEGETETETRVQLQAQVCPRDGLEWRILRRLLQLLGDLELRLGNYAAAILRYEDCLIEDLRRSFKLSDGLAVLDRPSTTLEDASRSERASESPDRRQLAMEAEYPTSCVEKILDAVERWVLDESRREDAAIRVSLGRLFRIVERMKKGIGRQTSLLCCSSSDSNASDWPACAPPIWVEWSCAAIDVIRGRGMASVGSFLHQYDEELWGDCRVLVAETMNDDVAESLVSDPPSEWFDSPSQLTRDSDSPSALSLRLQTQLDETRISQERERAHHSRAQIEFRKVTEDLANERTRNEGLMSESLELHEDLLSLATETLSLRKALAKFVESEVGCDQLEGSDGTLLDAEIRRENFAKFVSLGRRTNNIVFSLFHTLTIRTGRRDRLEGEVLNVSLFQHFPNLQELTVAEDSVLHDEIFSYIPKLKKLKIWDCANFTGKGFQYLSELEQIELYKVQTVTDEFLSHLTTLKRVHFWLCRNIAGECFRYYPNVEKLILNCVDGVTDEAIGRLRNLRKLQVFKRPQLTGECFAGLRRLRFVTIAYNHSLLDESLRRLTRCEKLTIRECQHVQGKCTWRTNVLRELNLEFCNSLTDEIFANLSKLVKLVIIQCLRLSGTGFRQLTHVQEVSIYDNSRLTDEGLSNLWTVRSLTLSRCNRITGTCFPSMCWLTSLFVYKTFRFGDSAFRGLPHLEHLEISECSSITGAGLEHLKVLRELKVSDCQRFDADRFFHHCVKLEEMEIEKCPYFTGVGLVLLPRLVKLSVIGCPRVDTDAIQKSNILHVQIDFIDARTDL